jgi:hypothetical protein
MPFPPLHAGSVVTADHATHILNGLKARTLPKPEWTHGAHLTAGVMLLDEVGLDGALAAMPDMIRSYNEATGVQNTDSDGYHHTITVFYLAVINDFCAERLDAPPHNRATSLLASPLARKNYPLEYYSKDRLFSVEARRDLVPPDLKHLEIMIVR